MLNPNEKSKLRMIRFSDIRWLGRLLYMDKTISNLKTIMAYFENLNVVEFSGIYRSLKDFRILEFLHVVRDILEHLNAISTIGQTEDLNIRLQK